MAEIVAYYQPLSGHVRTYQDGGPADFSAFCSSASVLWHDAENAEFVGMLSPDLSREVIAANTLALFEAGAKRLLARRANPHKMPKPWHMISSTPIYSVWALERNRDAIDSRQNQNLEVLMSVLSDKNTGAIITEIRDPNGDLLIKFTREYGAAVPTPEVLEIEKGLLELANQLQTKLG